MEIAINDIEDYSGRFRVRSERRRKRAVKEAYDKNLLRLGREWDAIRRKRYSVGWDELNPPVQRGYVRFFVLRDDIKRTKQAGFFENLLAKINVRQYSHRKDFLVKRRRYGKKVYASREHTLPLVESWELQRKKLTAEELAFFSEETIYHTRQHCSRIAYRFTEPWRFILRIQPNMITKVRKMNVDLDRREADLDRYFSFDNRLDHWVKLLNGNAYKWHSGPPKQPNPFLNRSFADILSEYYPEPMLRITHKDSQTPGNLYFYQANVPPPVSRPFPREAGLPRHFSSIYIEKIEPLSPDRFLPVKFIKLNRQVH
ncbi:hypothetical protein [Parachryseolinea silvisoli]|uniref:hypothetical protein n=1 Tax=Parachryseolinea silvisoli TaxID=2873601 RepID=UPI0022659983|nr:hypothetical protein [Parachryseolinea silvisoli]MCD9016586.1 hypothetical protein [Parachryseolinea silvisoli]